MRLRRGLDGGGLAVLCWLTLFAVMLFAAPNAQGQGLYRHFVMPSQAWLLWAALGLLALMFVDGLFASGGAAAGCACGGDDDAHDHEPDGECDHAHEPPPGARLAALGWLLHAAPLLLLGILGGYELGGYAASISSAERVAVGPEGRPAAPSDARAAAPVPFDARHYQRTNLMYLYRDKKFAAGEHRVTVVGRYYLPKPEDLPEELRDRRRVMLLAIASICCAADSQPLTVLLEGADPARVRRPAAIWDESMRSSEIRPDGAPAGPDPEKLAREGQWVRVWGRAAVIPGKSGLIRIVTERLDELKQPPGMTFILMRSRFSSSPEEPSDPEIEYVRVVNEGEEDAGY